MRRSVVVAAAAVAVLAVAVAFVVVVVRDGRGGDPARIAAADVPFSLLDAHPSSAPPVAEAGARRATLFFVHQDALVPVGRALPEGATARDVLDELLAGPTPEESAAGLSTLLDPAVDVAGAAVSQRRALVDFGKPLPDATDGTRRSLALAQIVFTLTDLPAVRDVRFLLDGSPVEVPVGDGRLTRAAVARADYPVPVVALPSGDA